jgi:transposase
MNLAAVLDEVRRLLDVQAFPTTTRGYAQLATWAESFGQVERPSRASQGAR